MTVDDAQDDLRKAYVGGGVGVLVSALIWFATAFVERQHGVGTAFAVLFFSGMTIYPVSTLLARFGFRRARESAENPLGMTALESTIAMIGGLFAAWLFLPIRPELVFPLAAIAVGTHYFAFKTCYGDRLFWLLGALVTLVGLMAIYRPQILPGGLILTVALIEVAFAALLMLGALRVKPAER